MNANMIEKLAAEFVAFQERVPVSVITNEAEYNRAVEMLDSILDLIGEDETSAMARLAETVGTLVVAYDNEHHKMPDASPVDVLHFLMETHGLTQSELPEVGNQSTVSQVLSGRRDLNARQIGALCKRFGVSADAFIPAAS